MIKFFRHIRQRMIKENRVSKYILYAIGEIVLVVIGILLALQINNWNEDRKNSSRLQGYTKSLIEDLVNDSLSVSATLNYIKEDSLLLAEFEQRVNLSEHPLDTLYHIARYEYNHYVGMQVDFNDDTYEMLSSTGDLALFDQEIVKELMDLANLKQRVMSSGNSTWEILNYSRKYPVRAEHSFVQSGSRIDELMHQEVSLTEHAALFNALVTSKKNVYRITDVFLPELLDRNNALLEKLRKK